MAAKPRIQAMTQDAVTAGLLPKHPLETRLAAIIGTATSTCLGALDDEDRATAKLYVQKAAQAAEVAWQQTIRGLQGPSVTHPTVSVDRYTFYMHSHCSAQTTCAPCSRMQGSSLSCVAKIVLHPRVMFHLALDNTLNHQHKFSLTYLSSVTIVYFSGSRPVVYASIYLLQRSTAGWHFCGIPTSHSVSPRTPQFRLSG